MRRCLQDRSGLSAVEYAICLGAIGLILSAVAVNVGDTLDGYMTSLVDRLGGEAGESESESESESEID